MARIEGVPDLIRERIANIYARSGIDYRYSCLGDYGAEAKDFEFYPKNWGFSPVPTTGDRNQQYKICALDLAEQVAHQALWQAKLVAEDIPSHCGELHRILCTWLRYSFSQASRVICYHRSDSHWLYGL
jgi:hypothetical protein